MFTNTVPVDAYRGAGRPEATFVLERLVDVAASDMGIDRVEIRRRTRFPRRHIRTRRRSWWNTTAAIQKDA